MTHGYLKPRDMKPSDAKLKPNQLNYLDFKNDKGSSDIWGSVKKGGAVLLGTLGTLAAIYSFSGCNSVDGSQVESNKLERNVESGSFQVPKGKGSGVYDISNDLKNYKMNFDNSENKRSPIGQSYSQE